MDTRQISVAVAIAAHGSFADAARALFMAESTVSRKVAALEKELGVQLFARGPRRTEPTEAGRAFLAAAGDVLDALDRAVGEARRVVPPAHAAGGPDGQVGRSVEVASALAEVPQR